MASFGFQLVNFIAASRKRFLIPFGLFSPNDNVSWIANVVPAGGTQALVGAIDGTNVTFTVPQTIGPGTLNIYRNGLLQDTPSSYTISGQTVTFTSPPQPTDSLQAEVVVFGAAG